MNMTASLGHTTVCFTFSLPDFGGHGGALVTAERRLDPPPDHEVCTPDPLGLRLNARVVGGHEADGQLPDLLHLLPVKATQQFYLLLLFQF